MTDDAPTTYTESVVRTLMDQGFPISWAESLAPLAIAHPEWRFEPFFVPESWEEILYYEVDENPARSLITKAEPFAAYRHEENTTLYDTGHYQASRAAVSYFMDPRNFFNEEDIFQFYCYATDRPGDDVQAAVQAVLAGTFMENADAGDGEDYAAAFVRIGGELGISPLYLAVRVHQEQGSAGGMTADGKGGQLLSLWQSEGTKGAPASTDEDLLRYDGYYNLFNIRASGTGSYTILREAMCRAMEGTPDMSEAWGGSAAWDTPAKSIYGGALYIRSSYFANGQNTAYLQKYNVSPDSSRRFWGQYMQNIVAALSEGRALYRAYAAADALSLPATFRIPVYHDIPAACPDPAGGKCAYTAVSTAKYTLCATLSVNGQELTLPPSYPAQLSQGKLATLQTTAVLSDGLRLRGTLSVDGRMTRVTLRAVYKNGAAYNGAPQLLYQKEGGCDELHLTCRLSTEPQAAAGDVYTYLLTLETGSANTHASVLPVALLEITLR